jgi:hypothetical protein
MDLSEEEKRGLDERELEEVMRLQSEYGHSANSAWLLARYSRDMLQQSLERPVSPVIVTGI